MSDEIFDNRLYSKPRRIAVSVKTVVVLVLAAVVLWVGFAVCSGVSYSQGSRIGTVQKFSRKGIIVKTWEGELAMEGFSRGKSGASGSVWSFSVSDSAVDPVTGQKVVEVIQKAMDQGEMVNLKYTEYWFKGRYETAYQVTSVSVIGQ